VLDPARVAAPAAPGGLKSLAAIEREAIQGTLTAVGGNRKEAAERLGIGLRTLYEKLKRYRLA
jgi:two-component system, NtrC family, response regulator AtoC